ncbi:MAG TPA: FAD-binding oxidoreductase [Solirubrobacteraceae bacterium]|nr:FAD-binding oxidoreductase [Solirubrobacteraceae bacterium]
MTREQVFWGWGEPGAGPVMPAHAEAWLREQVGVPGGVVSQPVALEDVRLREPALPAGLRERLVEIAGAGGVRDDREIRVLRAAGKSYLDLLAQRAGACEDAPDAVVEPASHEQVLAVLQACNDAGVAVVPFGGGTSVVGGVAPARGRWEALVSLDLGRMDALVEVDRRSLIARLQPGLRLPEADHRLAAHGLTLGHFPQSYEWATVGGCVAARSAGQASSGFGRIDANLVAARAATPLGDWATLPVPASAAGPSLRQLLAGSEGALGVLTEVTLRVRPLPAERRYEGWFLRSFGEGWEVLRALAQDGLAPDVARLSDEPETRMSLALAGRHGVKGLLGAAVLRARGFADGCLLICGWEGTADARRGEAARRLRAAGAMAAGRSPGEAWLRARYAGPHLRDDLLDRGVLVETLETAATWTGLGDLYRAVRDALAGALPGAHVACHVSHVYATGASLYFTVLAAQDRDDPAGQWRRAKDAACAAIVGAGGTLSHHHAIGRDHAPWLAEEVGALGLEVLRAVKERVDPAGILNPGKLLPAAAAG